MTLGNDLSSRDIVYEAVWWLLRNDQSYAEYVLETMSEIMTKRREITQWMVENA